MKITIPHVFLRYPRLLKTYYSCVNDKDSTYVHVLSMLDFPNMEFLLLQENARKKFGCI